MPRRALSLVLPLLLAACSSSVCPYPDTSTLIQEPPPPQGCLDVQLTSCVKPTLKIKSNCDLALYMPIAYGVFSTDAATGTEIEVVKNDTLTYEVRDDKATASTPKKKDYVIPARLGEQRMTFRFSVSSSE